MFMTADPLNETGPSGTDQRLEPPPVAGQELAIAAELRSLPRWAVWRPTDLGGQELLGADGQPRSPDDAALFGTFDDAVRLLRDKRAELPLRNSFGFIRSVPAPCWLALALGDLGDGRQLSAIVLRGAYHVSSGTIRDAAACHVWWFRSYTERGPSYGLPCDDLSIFLFSNDRLAATSKENIEVHTAGFVPMTGQTVATPHPMQRDYGQPTGVRHVQHKHQLAEWFHGTFGT
jgi:hypothetical protein